MTPTPGDVLADRYRLEEPGTTPVATASTPTTAKATKP